ncbi:hypothetical protein AAF712_016464 [Marasmius tenuissimus]|uniref:Uncharacterized protein n=1 Tax=Marasmius tenuissimus TaxID=585030 RepID=A0ABR2Z6N5_9AGAR
MEIKRKVTLMLDDSADYHWAEQRAMQAGDTDYAILLSQERQTHSVFCKDIACCLVNIANLHGFSGWATLILGLYHDQSNIAGNMSTPSSSDGLGHTTQANLSNHQGNHQGNPSTDDAESDGNEGMEVDRGECDDENNKSDRLLLFVESLSIE